MIINAKKMKVIKLCVCGREHDYEDIKQPDNKVGIWGEWKTLYHSSPLLCCRRFYLERILKDGSDKGCVVWIGIEK